MSGTQLPVQLHSDMPVTITMPAGAWDRVLWALGKQPHETVDVLIAQIRQHMMQAAMQAQESPQESMRRLARQNGPRLVPEPEAAPAVSDPPAPDLAS